MNKIYLGYTFALTIGLMTTAAFGMNGLETAEMPETSESVQTKIQAKMYSTREKLRLLDIERDFLVHVSGSLPNKGTEEHYKSESYKQCIALSSEIKYQINELFALVKKWEALDEQD